MEVESNGKWRAGGGTTALGIIGTALGGLATVAGGGALLGGNGIMGNNNQTQKENNELRAQVARLQSEKYTDSHVLELGKQLTAVDISLHAVDDKLEKAIIRNAADIAAVRELNGKDLEIAKQQAKIDTLQLDSRLTAQINAVAASAGQGIQTNAGAIACLQNLVSGITKTYVPSSSVCGSSSGCCPIAQQ